MMGSFDITLRRALIDANLMQYQSVLEDADSTGPDFSPRYCRERTRLLSDPVGWVRRRGRPLWKRVMRNVACILLACSLALGSLMAVSPTVRAAVLNWLREITGNLVTYSSGSNAEHTAEASDWRPTWMPEGWVMTDLIGHDTAIRWMYRNEESGARLIYACYAPGYGSIQTNIGEVLDADAVRKVTTVQGYSADYYESESTGLLAWEDRDGNLFWLRVGWQDNQQFLEQIAASLTPYSNPAEAYELGWIPNGYTLLERCEVNGAAQEEWTKDGVSLIFQYVADPICPFEVPDGEPEEVSVGGLPAQYWGGEASEQDADSGENESSVNMGSISITVSTSPGDEESGTLVWTDPDTNTTFLLNAALDKYDLLRMAESITVKEAEEAPVQKDSPSGGKSMIIGGTASDE